MPMDAYIFDVDGVITDPVTKTANSDVLKKIAALLETDFIALNTGRSFSWVEEKILSPLSEITQDSSLYKNLFIVCEKGNVLAQLENDSWQKNLLDDPLPEEIQEKIKQLAKEHSESMFFDESKETMISVEMNDGFDVATYRKFQKELHNKAQELLEAKYHDMEFIIDPSTISLDIQYEDAGKQLGAERIEDYMLSKGIKVDKMYMFGDSQSDTDMAQALQDSHTVIFIYVGEGKLYADKLTCEVVYADQKFTAGTLEYLGKLD